MSRIRALFRCDAGPQLGGGHVMRCMALAWELEKRGAEIAFAVNEGAEAAAPALSHAPWPRLIAESPHDAPLPEAWPDAGILVADLYSLDAAGCLALRQKTRFLAAIDDLSDRPLHVDLLLDPAPGKCDGDYDGLLPASAERLVGPGYALLRPEFAQRRAASLARRAAPALQRVLVSMGLTDIGGVTRSVVEILRRSAPNAEIEAVIGSHAASRPALEALARADERLIVTINAADMAARMARADLAIGAGGGTALERCALGLPSIILVLAGNQRAAANALDAAGAGVCLPAGAGLGARLGGLIQDFEQNPERLAAMSRAASEVCDGQGATRVADRICALTGNGK